MLRWIAWMMLLCQLGNGCGSLGASTKAVLAMQTGVLLRLHVVANSDNSEDQRVKLSVAEAVRETYGALVPPHAPMLAAAKAHLSALTQAAQARAQEEHYPGEVEVCVEQHWFEGMELDGMTFPAGWYPALMVRLGAAQGHNCWGLLDQRLALEAAETQVEGWTVWEGEGVTWRLILVELFRRLCGEGVA